MNKKWQLLLSIESIKGLFACFFRYIPIYLYTSLLNRPKQLWLITERPSDARDNGYFLYKWIRENHSDKRVVYAIKKESKDYEKVKDLGEVVEFGSFKHWYFFFMASVCCGTGWDICVPNGFSFILMRNILPPKGKRMFLQHGVIKDYMPQGRKQKLKADVFVCGAFPEWEYISKNFGYSNGEVKYLGLARFDELKDTSNANQILFMPTWRAGIGKHADFKKTNYYHRISSLLKSEKLYRLLEETNTDLIYFIHPTINDKKRYFKDLGKEHIHIFNNYDTDMQQFICSSKMLITDYSSVYFDFAYQLKPVLYYQYDYDEYRKTHYDEGYFSYEKDGFGPIVDSLDDLIEQVSLIISNNWKMDNKFVNRSYSFFPIRDSDNCQRHYETICELDDRRVK